LGNACRAHLVLNGHKQGRVARVCSTPVRQRLQALRQRVAHRLEIKIGRVHHLPPACVRDGVCTGGVCIVLSHNESGRQCKRPPPYARTYPGVAKSSPPSTSLLSVFANWSASLGPTR
jgi:hypothetical protein